MIRRYRERLLAAVSAWKLRERVLVLAAVLVLALGLSYLLAVEPLLAARARQAAEARTWQTELTALRAQRDAARPSQPRPADAPLARQLAAWRAQSAELERQISEAGAPDAQVRLLRPAVQRLLGRHERIQLVRLEAATRAAGLTTPLLAPPSAAASAPVAPAAETARRLERYTVKVTLEGSYLDLLAYLESLERELPEVRWSELKLSVADSGSVRLSLGLYMWLKVAS